MEPSFRECAFRAPDAQDMRALGGALGSCLADGDAVALIGGLGAGKTCFAQGVAAGMGIVEDVVSPTFNILLTYQGQRGTLHHFDLYRLDDAAQLEDTGYFECTDEGTPGACLIEWADLFPDELPESALYVRIAAESAGDGSVRIVHVHAGDARATSLLSRWISAVGQGGRS